MQIARPDPYHENPKSAALRFRRALRRVLTFLLILWGVLVLDLILDLDLRQFGVGPQRLTGLIGLLSMPLLHGGVAHLLHNTLPTLLLGAGLLYFYPQTCWRVIPWFWVFPGMFVWLTGVAGSTHFGASGLNFAMLAYLGLGGLLRREVGTLAVSLGVMFYYGGMLSGVLPIKEGVSWEGHLGGFVIGSVLAIVYRRWDIPPRKRYDWEDEPEEPLEIPDDLEPGDGDRAEPPPRVLH